LVEACRFLEREAKQLLEPRRIGVRGRPAWLFGTVAEISREPMGVVLIIGPGNYPLFLAGAQLLQALVAGNGVLLKPGARGSRVALLFRNLLLRAGFDPDLISVLDESPEAGRAAIAAGADKVVFTGSDAVGQQILQQLARQITPSVMELGGSDAVIVRQDADLDLVSRALAFGLGLNGGATCMAPKRVYVHAGRATELEGRLAELFGAKRGIAYGKQSIREPMLSRLRDLCADAFARGAHLIAGEIQEDRVLAPVVLGGVMPQARLLREEVFAPVLALVTVKDDDEAVSLANRSEYGLAASIFSRHEDRAREIAARIRAGVVTINDLIVPTADARLPFGGRGRSGFGSTRGAEGLLELTSPKVVTISHSKYRPALEPPREADASIFRSYLKLAHGRGLKQRLPALLALGRSIFQRMKHSS
jgi:acyl-CoA reductase-like NAD-dependent aldehyde dehydrogenase